MGGMAQALRAREEEKEIDLGHSRRLNPAGDVGWNTAIYHEFFWEDKRLFYNLTFCGIVGARQFIIFGR